MLKARKANRVVKIPDEKKKTYIALGYTITDMDGNVLHEHVEPSEKLAEAEKEIEDLKAKLEEVTLYAEDADKKITDLQKENEELKAAIQAQATMGSAAPVSEDSGKKKTTKTPKQSE